jgi:hypothetical protein
MHCSQTITDPHFPVLQNYTAIFQSVNKINTGPHNKYHTMLKYNQLCILKKFQITQINGNKQFKTYLKCQFQNFISICGSKAVKIGVWMYIWIFITEKACSYEIFWILGSTWPPSSDSLQKSFRENVFLVTYYVLMKNCTVKHVYIIIIASVVQYTLWLNASATVVQLNIHFCRMTKKNRACKSNIFWNLLRFVGG